MWPIFLVILLIPLVSSTDSVNSELTKLVNQVQTELTTFCTNDQFIQLFTRMAELFRSQDDIISMARTMYHFTSDILTDIQRKQCWESIEKAMNSLGGRDNIHSVIMNALLSFNKMMGDSIKMDREEFSTLEKSGNTQNEVNTAVYKRLQQYWNITFGQKVIDTIKHSMTQEQWAIVSKDASQYMKVQNFNMNY